MKRTRVRAGVSVFYKETLAVEGGAVMVTSLVSMSLPVGTYLTLSNGRRIVRADRLFDSRDRRIATVLLRGLLYNKHAFVSGKQ